MEELTEAELKQLPPDSLRKTARMIYPRDPDLAFKLLEYACDGYADLAVNVLLHAGGLRLEA